MVEEAEVEEEDLKAHFQVPLWSILEGFWFWGKRLKLFLFPINLCALFLQVVMRMEMVSIAIMKVDQCLLKALLW